MTGTALLMKQQQESKELPQPAKKLLLPEPLYPTTLLWSGLSGPQIVFSRYDLKPLMRTNLMCIVAPSQSMLGGGKKQPCPSARARHFHRAAVLCFSAGLVVGGFGGNESGPTVFPTALYQRSLSGTNVKLVQLFSGRVRFPVQFSTHIFVMKKNLVWYTKKLFYRRRITIAQRSLNRWYNCANFTF